MQFEAHVEQSLYQGCLIGDEGNHRPCRKTPRRLQCLRDNSLSTGSAFIGVNQDIPQVKLTPFVRSYTHSQAGFFRAVEPGFLALSIQLAIKSAL